MNKDVLSIIDRYMYQELFVLSFDQIDSKGIVFNERCQYWVKKCCQGCHPYCTTAHGVSCNFRFSFYYIPFDHTYIFGIFKRSNTIIYTKDEYFYSSGKQDRNGFKRL